MNWNPSLLEEINKYRLTNGLKPLEVDSVLCDAANKRVEEIKTNWSHEGFSASLCEKCNGLGENLARGFEKKENIVQAWIESLSHKKVILTESFTHGCTVYDQGYAVFEAGSIYHNAGIEGSVLAFLIIVMSMVKSIRI